MRAIFTNNAVSRLTSEFLTGNYAIYIDDTSNFPHPIVGQEYFHLTIVGACDARVEIVRVVENTGDSLRIDRRGEEETVEQAFSPGDGAYHSLTADVVQEIIDSWRWYLGPYSEPPETDNNGDPLEAGHLYYQLANPNIEVNAPIMLVWDGSAWRPFNPTIAGTQIANYTWQLLVENPPGLELPWPDTYGQMPVDLDPSRHAVDLYLNGSKILEDLDPIIQGDYVIKWDLDIITILHGLQMGDVIEAKVLLRSDDASLDFIRRDETDASGFGFVANEGETISAIANYLPTVERVESYVDNAVLVGTSDKVRWRNKWLNQPYSKNDMVRDGFGTYIANKATSERPEPVPLAPPFDIPIWGTNDEPMTFPVPVIGNLSVVAGNNYTLGGGGQVTSIRFWGFTGSLVSKVRVMDITNALSPTVIYEAFVGNVLLDEWNVIPLPVMILPSGRVIRVETYADGVDVPYVQNIGYWNRNNIPWTTTEGGYLEIDGIQIAGVSGDSFGIDVQFQMLDVSADWDIVALSGSGGIAGGGGGSGVPHTISDLPPDDAVGNNGDIWMVPTV